MTYNYIDDQTEYRDLSDQIAILREEINEIPLRVAVPEITYGVPGSGSGGGGGSGDGTLQNYATQAWVEAQNYVTDAWLATEKYVTDAWLATEKYVTEAWLATEKYVTEAWIATEKYVTEAWLATEKYITEAWIATEKYVTEAWLATEKYITEAWVATQKYVTEAWLATEKYITEAWIATEKYVTEAWLATEKYVTEAWITLQDFATKAWVDAQNYVTDAWLATEKYITEAWLATEKYITEAWVATQKYVTEAWLATEKYITEAWIATEKYVTEAWVATQEFATKAWIGIQGFAKNAYNTAAAVVGGFASLFGITVPASDTDVEAADKVFVRKTPKTGGGDVDIGTFDLIRVDRVFFESNDGVDLTHSTPHITGKDNAFSIYVPNTKYIDVYCGSAKAASVYKTVTKVFGAFSVTGGKPTVVANGHMWLNKRDLYIRSGDADYNLTNTGSGWVATATSDLDMNDNDVKDVDKLYFEKTLPTQGTAYDQYLEGGSTSLNYRSSLHDFYAKGDKSLRIGKTAIQCHVPVNLRGSEPVVFFNGEMWITNKNVYVRSGGVSRNLSNIGSLSSWVATAASDFDMDNNDINNVDKLYFKRTTGLSDPYLTADGSEIFAYINNVKTSLTGSGGGGGSSTWVATATSDLDMNNSDINNVAKLYFRKTSGSSDPYMTAVGEEIFAYIDGVKTAITGGSGSSSWVDLATSNLDMDNHNIEDVDKLYFKKTSGLRDPYLTAVGNEIFAYIDNVKTVITGGSGSSSWVATATSDLDMDNNDIENVDKLSFKPTSGSTDPYITATSNHLILYSKSTIGMRIDSSVINDVNITDSYVQINKTLRVNGTTSSIRNGSMWISGSDVMIRSGGKNVNITNL